MSTAAPHQTATPRWSFCRRFAFAFQDGLLSTKTTFVDHGFRRGGDLKRLHHVGVLVSSRYPAFFPGEHPIPASPFEDTRSSSLTPVPDAVAVPGAAAS